MKKKKLNLNKEVIVNLSNEEMNNVIGGQHLPNTFKPTTCDDPSKPIQSVIPCNTNTPLCEATVTTITIGGTTTGTGNGGGVIPGTNRCLIEFTNDCVDSQVCATGAMICWGGGNQ